MSNSNEKNNNRKSTRFIIAGMIVAIAITSLLGVFLSVPKKSSAYVMPTLEVESQPEIRSSIWRVIRYALEAASAVAWKKAYSYFLNKIAYDTAVALTSGGKGQKPLIITDFGEYMKEAADGAAGEYLDSASQEIFGESLCTFTPKVQIGITAGVASLLGSTREPKKADCPLTEIVANVERISKMSTSDLIDFQKSFNM
ncbi:hypothetical protein KKG41_04185, partial [Patescibacteria group bacterium]|nr:hypothetical protein [Patescibacteria group bacterium]MBU1890801.1 hypothetical protein [Patescibacteria group bacterium]